MLDWTDRHCRWLHRQLHPQALLYTEMVVAKALQYIRTPEKLLDMSDEEGAVCLQLGGSDPAVMAAAVRRAECYPYDHYNINVGCPSDRVADGQFGACLMARPYTVAECVRAMKDATDKPVTIKTRLGINGSDSEDFLYRLLDKVTDAGCDGIILHARIAVLGGLSPKENRQVPPLRYADVYKAARRYAGVPVVINGGIDSLEAIARHDKHCSGVMVGRKAYHDPWWLTTAARLQGLPAPENRLDAAKAYADYLQRCEQQGIAVRGALRHAQGLFLGQPHARRWRQMLGEDSRGMSVSDGLRRAIDVMEQG